MSKVQVLPFAPMENLTGKKVLQILKDDTDTYLLFKTDQGDLCFETYGDCCARPYICSIEGSEDILNEVVTEVLQQSIDSLEHEGGYVTDIIFYTIKSTRGRLNIDFRVEHNGYYGGDLKSCDVPNKVHWNVVTS